MSPAQLAEASHTVEYKNMAHRSIIGSGVAMLPNHGSQIRPGTSNGVNNKGKVSTIVPLPATSSFVVTDKPMVPPTADGAPPADASSLPPPTNGGAPQSPTSPKAASPVPSSGALVLRSAASQFNMLAPSSPPAANVGGTPEASSKDGVHHKYSTASSGSRGSRFDIGWFTRNHHLARWRTIGTAVVLLALWCTIICIVVILTPGRQTLCKNVPRKWWYVTFANTLGWSGLQAASMLFMAFKLKKFGNDALGIRNEIMSVVVSFIIYGCVVYPGLNATKASQPYLWCSIAILIHIMWMFGVGQPLIMAFRVWRKEAVLAMEIQTMGSLAELLKIPVAAQAFAKFVSAQFCSGNAAHSIHVLRFRFVSCLYLSVYRIVCLLSVNSTIEDTRPQTRARHHVTSIGSSNR